MTLLNFVKGIKYLSLCYDKKIDESEIKAWYQLFKKITYVDFMNAIKQTITTSKFYPKAPELKQKCIEVKREYLFKIINHMKEDGYFKIGSYGELSEEQEYRNYDKTLMWLEKGIIPDFLKEDIKVFMNKYPKQIATVKGGKLTYTKDM